MSLSAAARDGRREMLARILPFAIYIAFLAAGPYVREVWPAHWDSRWLYAVKITAVVLALVWFARRYAELQPAMSGWRDMVEAVAAGALVFVLWIKLDFSWAVVTAPDAGYDPRSDSGELNWALVAVRLFGAAIVVPVMEELFWRSFLMRWIDRQDFLLQSPAAVSLRAVVISSVVFGFEHNLWLAGILAGLAYGLLYRRSGSLWSPVIAHATTNLLLGLWVVATGSWHFW